MARRRHGCRVSPPTSCCILLLVAALLTVFCNRSASAIDGIAISPLDSLSSYSNLALLDTRFELYWTVNSSDATIHMAVNAKTKGWFGVGISEVGSMVGSDALVAWVEQSEARAYATDRFIFNKTTEGIALDDKQDWHVLGGSQTTNQSTGDTWTTVHVWRQLDTGDCNDRPIVPGKLHNIIWAMGANTDVSYHSADRGSSALVLAPAPGPSIVAPAPPPSASSSASAASLAAPQQAGKQQPAQQAQQQQESMLNFTFTNYRLPTDFTTYRCKLWAVVSNTPGDLSSPPQLPPYSKEYGNLKGAGADFDCLHDTPCGTTVAVWAVGGRPFTFPPNVGYPIGPGYFTKFVLQTIHLPAQCRLPHRPGLLHQIRAAASFSRPLRSLSLPRFLPSPHTPAPRTKALCPSLSLPLPPPPHPQVHFTNPKGRADLIDNSGLCLKLAPSLRPMDASIMLTGPVHFTNPKCRSDLIDNSGLYLKLAPSLRPMDASIMLTGPVPYEYLIKIPPAMPSWTQVSTCPGECTSKVFGNESVKIIGSFLHLHTLGRQHVPYEYLIKIPPAMPSWTQVSTCPGECSAKVFGNESVKIIGSFLHLHTLGRQVRV
ncbi:unnamed protein product [Closterium sp. Yama58-4]|nr:unnamed protein product [Closterium sp. Yama58-4]